MPQWTERVESVRAAQRRRRVRRPDLVAAEDLQVGDVVGFGEDRVLVEAIDRMGTVIAIKGELEEGAICGGQPHVHLAYRSFEAVERHHPITS